MKHYKEYLFTFLFISFVFTGCQSAMSVFDKTGTQYERGLQYTKVKSLLSNNKTVAIINASYLNSINGNKWNKAYQNMLIGLYITNDNTKDYINNADFNLTINDKAYLTYTNLESKHKEFSNIPLKNPWAKYYIVTFPNYNNDKKLILKYKHSTLGSVSLEFEKE
jgi:hypothetical protein